jgi:hypothetical protein
MPSPSPLECHRASKPECTDFDICCSTIELWRRCLLVSMTVCPILMTFALPLSYAPLEELDGAAGFEPAANVGLALGT